MANGKLLIKTHLHDPENSSGPICTKFGGFIPYKV